MSGVYLILFYFSLILIITLVLFVPKWHLTLSQPASTFYLQLESYYDGQSFWFMAALVMRLKRSLIVTFFLFFLFFFLYLLSLLYQNSQILYIVFSCSDLSVASSCCVMLLGYCFLSIKFKIIILFLRSRL